MFHATEGFSLFTHFSQFTGVQTVPAGDLRAEMSQFMWLTVSFPSIRKDVMGLLGVSV